jgi:NO-binding membrane sensor protein with MHYT domain
MEFNTSDYIASVALLISIASVHYTKNKATKLK